MACGCVRMGGWVEGWTDACVEGSRGKDECSALARKRVTITVMKIRLRCDARTLVSFVPAAAARAQYESSLHRTRDGARQQQQRP